MPDNSLGALSALTLLLSSVKALTGTWKNHQLFLSFID